MKPTLKNEPRAYTYKELLVNFESGKPLSCDMINFLARHEKALSSSLLDPVLKYYLKNRYGISSDQHSFLLPSEKFNLSNIEQLKRRLKILLQAKSSKIELKITPEQFLDFKKIASRELILFHGNQFLTGAPFHPGGIPYIIYFQWGNLFGVAKYVILPEERALKSNVLIYFEDMQERKLIECVYQYNHEHADELRKQPQLMPVPQQREEPTQRSTYSTPTLSLSRSKENNQDDKK